MPPPGVARQVETRRLEAWLEAWLERRSDRPHERPAEVKPQAVMRPTPTHVKGSPHAHIVPRQHVRGREELGEILAIRHTRERLRRPAADIGFLARGNPYMASRGIAPTTTLRASARG